MAHALSIRDPKSIRTRTKVAVGAVALALAFISPDTGLFIFGMVVIFFLVEMFFSRMQPPVLLFAAFSGWFFSQGQMITGLFKGESVVTLSFFSPTKPTIILLGFLATISFFVGVYLTSRRVRTISYEEFRSFLMRVNLERLFLFYVGVYILLFFLGSNFWALSAFAQPIFVMSQFKWSIFYILFVTVFVQNRMKGWLFALIIIDIVLSFFSFFAHFREAIYFSLLSYWIFYFRSSWGAKVFTIICLVGTFYLGAFWTAVKKDYRDFLNRGTGVQAVRVSREEAYSKLIDLVSNVKGEEFDVGIEDLVTRMSWIGAFDAVYNHVPAKIQHTNGDLWTEGVTRPFLPRFFFPEKKALADSKELNYYSGLRIDEEQTSISLSAVAGSYVDFGRWGMFIPMFLFGIFCGWVYKKVMLWGRHPVIGQALTMPLIYLMLINEQSISRIVSAMVLFFFAAWFIQKFGLNPFLNFILVPKKKPALERHVNEASLG